MHRRPNVPDGPGGPPPPNRKLSPERRWSSFPSGPNHPAPPAGGFPPGPGRDREGGFSSRERPSLLASYRGSHGGFPDRRPPPPRPNQPPPDFYRDRMARVPPMGSARFPDNDRFGRPDPRFDERPRLLDDRGRLPPRPDSRPRMDFAPPPPGDRPRMGYGDRPRLMDDRPRMLPYNEDRPRMYNDFDRHRRAFSSSGGPPAYPPPPLQDDDRRRSFPPRTSSPAKSPRRGFPLKPPDRRDRKPRWRWLNNGARRPSEHSESRKSLDGTRDAVNDGASERRVSHGGESIARDEDEDGRSVLDLEDDDARMDEDDRSEPSSDESASDEEPDEVQSRLPSAAPVTDDDAEPKRQGHDEKEDDEPPISKEELASRMDKLDDEISKYEALLESIKRQKTATIEPAEPPEEKKEEQPRTPVMPKRMTRVESRLSEIGSSDVIERIFRENRTKINRAVDSLPPPLRHAQTKPALPALWTEKADGDKSKVIVSYQQPSDLPSYQDVLDRFEKLKPRLLRFLARRMTETRNKAVELGESYEEMFDAWQLRVAKWENSQRKKYLKLHGGKAPNNQRSGRSRGYASEPSYNLEPSDPTTLPYFPNGYGNDDDYRYIKTLVPVPPMLMDERIREHCQYMDENRLFEDSPQSIRLRNAMNPWHDDEKAVFSQKYLEYPKEFGRIAAFLPNKSAQDCVLFYYLNKKPLKLRNLTKQALAIRNRKRKKMADNNQQMTQSTSSVALSSASYDRREDGAVFNNDYDDGNARPDEEPPETGWNEDELAAAKTAFLEHGKNFYAVALQIGTKTILACRKLYVGFKRRYGINLTKVKTEKSKRKRKKDDDGLTEAEERAAEPSDREPGEKRRKRGRQPKKQQQQQQQDEDDDQQVDDTPPVSPIIEEKKEKRRTVSYWTTKEKAEFLKHFVVHGRDWRALAQVIPSKSEIQIRNYYQNNKHLLDPALERKAAGMEDGKLDSLASPRSRKDGDDKSGDSKAMYPLGAGMYPYPFQSTVGPDGSVRYGLGVDAAKWAAAAHLAAASGVIPPAFAMYPPALYAAGRPGMPQTFPFIPMASPGSNPPASISAATVAQPTTPGVAAPDAAASTSANPTVNPPAPASSTVDSKAGASDSKIGSSGNSNGNKTPTAPASVPFLATLGQLYSTFPPIAANQQTKAATAVAAQTLNSLDTLARYAISAGTPIPPLVAPVIRPPGASGSGKDGKSSPTEAEKAIVEGEANKPSEESAKTNEDGIKEATKTEDGGSTEFSKTVEGDDDKDAKMATDDAPVNAPSDAMDVDGDAPVVEAPAVVEEAPSSPAAAQEPTDAPKEEAKSSEPAE